MIRILARRFIEISIHIEVLFYYASRMKGKPAKSRLLDGYLNFTPINSLITLL